MTAAGTSIASETRLAETEVAIVFMSGVAGDPRVRVGGHGLLERALLGAARAGVRRCFVAGDIASIAPDARYPEITALPSTPAAAMQALHAHGVTPEDAVLCISACAVFHPPALTHLRRQPADAGPVVLADGHRVLPLAAALVHDLPLLWPAFADGDAGALRGLAANRRVAQSAPGGFAAVVRFPADIPPTERDLLSAIENPRDGRVDTLFNRRLSRPLSRLFLRSSLRPNHITVLAFVVAVLGALAFARGTYAGGLIGAVLFQCAAVLDCCDGEVARVKFQESRFGDILDITLDAIANTAIFGGIAWGVWTTGQLANAARLGLMATAGIAGTFAVVTYIERRIPEDTASPAHRLAHRLVSTMTNRDFSVIVAAAAVAGALRWLLWGAALGANAFWLVLLVLVLRGRAR